MGDPRVVASFRLLEYVFGRQLLVILVSLLMGLGKQ